MVPHEYDQINISRSEISEVRVFLENKIQSSVSRGYRIDSVNRLCPIPNRIIPEVEID
jgi:hypothetical protein